MQWREFQRMLKKLKGVFKPLIKRIYIGKIIYGTPYFHPTGFCSNIFRIRRLILTPQEIIEAEMKNRGEWMREKMKFSNLPIVRRFKDWIVKIFGSYYWIQIGWPISFRFNGLGWKDKYDTPRFEWSPAFSIYFFSWQYIVHWVPQDDEDKYWEMVLWYLYYSDEDIKKAEETWGWIDCTTKQSTWNKNNLL